MTTDLTGIGPPDYCWFHGEEPMPDDVYLCCGECGHYWTREALEAESGKPAETTWSCPLCVHDF